MQILRLHWRSLMPWDRSPDNHLTARQRRDYLMASLGWFRDLMMLAFSLLLLVITGLLAAQSSFAVAPLRHPLPPAHVAHRDRHHLHDVHAALLDDHVVPPGVHVLVISLAVTFVIARGCIEGLARRDGVFLRTSKAGAAAPSSARCA